MNSVSGASSSFSLRVFDKENRLKPEGNINKLPMAIEAKIFSYLKISDLGNISAVDKRRNEAVSTAYEKTPSLKERVVCRDWPFTSRDWKKYCGKDVDKEGESSSLSLNLYETFKSPCPVFPGKRIGQTHMLAWIPKTMNGEPLTLNSFGRVLKEYYFPDRKLGYGGVFAHIVKEKGDLGLDKSSWVFMTKMALPESEGRSYEEQERMVFNLDRQISYEIPKTLETVVCLSVQQLKSGELPELTTQCQELANNDRVWVGGGSVPNSGGFSRNVYVGLDKKSCGVGAKILKFL